MDEHKFTLFVTDGNLFEYDAYSSVIRYSDLTRAEALDLAERSMFEGYTVATFLQGDGCGEGDAECGKKA